MRDRVTGGGLVDHGRLLDEHSVPALLQEQVRRFTAESLRAKPVRPFDARSVIDVLQATEGRSVLAVDIGGDKIAFSLFEVRDKAVRETGNVFVRKGNGGEGYVDVLRQVSKLASLRHVPVGISFAGPTDGTRPVAGPNLPVFIREFSGAFGGDFANLFPAVELANDAEAGMMAAALEAARRYPETEDVIYVINGSGLGGAVLARGTICAAEPGHVPVIDELNVFGQDRPCGMDGASYVCLEAVAASKAGVEDIWLQRTGESATGHEIAARYLAGDQLAFALYDNSARVLAHVIGGMAEAFGLLDPARPLAVVGHGGIFHVPGYGERVRAISDNNLVCTPRILLSKEFSANTCLEGAAIAAAVKDVEFV